MAIEQTLVPALQAVHGATPVRNMHAEQLTDLLPSQVPLVILQRNSASFGQYQTLCGTSGAQADVSLEVDHIDLTLEGARRLADITRAEMTLNQQAVLEAEFDVYESAVGVYRVSSSFVVTDDNPSIT